MVMVAQNVSMIPGSIMYIDKPTWLNIWFIISVLVFIALCCIAAYAWFRISLRNRTNVIIHMPDKTRKHISYKNFTGDVFVINTDDKDADGKPVPHSYFFRPDAVERGYFGNYIEYDYKVSYPRMIGYHLDDEGKKVFDTKFSLKDEFVFISSLLNTDLAVDLLLSQKFKDFVKVMLLIVAIESFIAIAIGGYNAYGIKHIEDKIDTLMNITSSMRR